MNNNNKNFIIDMLSKKINEFEIQKEKHLQKKNYTKVMYLELKVEIYKEIIKLIYKESE